MIEGDHSTSYISSRVHPARPRLVLYPVLFHHQVLYPVLFHHTPPWSLTMVGTRRDAHDLILRVIEGSDNNKKYSDRNETGLRYLEDKNNIYHAVIGSDRVTRDLTACFSSLSEGSAGWMRRYTVLAVLLKSV